MLEQEGHEAGEGVGAREFMSRQTRDSRYPRLKRYPNDVTVILISAAFRPVHDSVW